VRACIFILPKARSRRVYNIEHLLHHAHIAIEGTQPDRCPKTVSPQSVFSSGNELRSNEIVFIPLDLQQGNALGSGDISLAVTMAKMMTKSKWYIEVSHLKK